MDEMLDKVQSAANESSRSARHVHLTFILVLAYVAFAVWSTTHEDLLRGRLVSLPLLRVEVPIWSFYAVAPWLVVILHFNLLLNLNFLSSKILALRDQINERLADKRQRQAQWILLDDFIFSHFVVGATPVTPTSRWGAFARRIHRMQIVALGYPLGRMVEEIAVVRYLAGRKRIEEALALEVVEVQSVEHEHVVRWIRIRS